MQAIITNLARLVDGIQDLQGSEDKVTTSIAPSPRQAIPSTYDVKMSGSSIAVRVLFSSLPFLLFSGSFFNETQFARTGRPRHNRRSVMDARQGSSFAEGPLGTRWGSLSGPLSASAGP